MIEMVIYPRLSCYVHLSDRPIESGIEDTPESDGALVC